MTQVDIRDVDDQSVDLSEIPPPRCKICGETIPCPHFWQQARANVLGRYEPARRWPRLRLRRGWPGSRSKSPIVACAFAVGVLIAGVGINACVSGGAPVLAAPLPNGVAIPGQTALPQDGGTPGPVTIAGGAGRAGGAGTTAAGSISVGGVPRPASSPKSHVTVHTSSPAPARSLLPPSPVETLASPVRALASTVTSVLPTVTIKDGTVRVGVDVPAGTYKAVGTTLACSWKILGGGLLGTVLGISSGLLGTQTVMLKTGQTFTTKGCGDWGKQ